MKIRMGLRTKAVITFSVLVIGVASILSFYFVNHEKNLIDEALQQRGLTLASNLAYNSEFGVLTSNESNLNKLIEGVVQQPDVAYAVVQDLEGGVLASMRLTDDLRTLDNFQAVGNVALKSKEPITQFFESFKGEQLYDIAVPIISQEIDIASDETGVFLGLEGEGAISPKVTVTEKRIGIVRVGISLQGAINIVRRSQKVITVITVSIILLAGLIATILSGIAIGPIRKLVEGTLRIARGDLDFHVSVKEGDEIAQLASSFNKMTEDLRRSRGELVKAKEYTDNIIKSMIDILVVVDPNGNIQTVNPATTKILGYEEEEVIGEPVDMIISVEGASISPRAYITKQMFRKGFIGGYEMNLRTKAGQSIPVIFSGSVMMSKDGKPEGMVSIAKNITDRKKAEEALRESNERFNSLAANMPGMIYQFVLRKDGSAYFPYVSPGCRELLGEEPETLEKDAMTVIDKIHHEDRSGFDKSVDESARTLNSWRWEGRFELDGQTKWIQGASRPKRQMDGSILWDGLLIDVSERKIAQSLIELKTKMLEKVNKELIDNEKQLKSMLSDLTKANDDLKKASEELDRTQFQLYESEKLKIVGRLASGVAHEVKNPLAIILQGVQFLSKRIPKNEKEVKEVVEDINSAVERADMVIKGVLDFASLSDLEMESRDINQVVDASLLLVKHELDQNHVEVTKKLSKKIPKLEIDRIKMEQVLVNILLNAVQSMKDGGKLTIKTDLVSIKEDDLDKTPGKQEEWKKGDKAVAIVIEDTGTGIDEEIMAKIFDPFFTTKGEIGGTGLGLSIIRNIVDLHKGKIKIENRDEGGVRTTVMLKA